MKQFNLILNRLISWPCMLCLAFAVLTISCEQKETLTMDMEESTESNPMDNKGIGPFKNVTPGPLDAALAKKGEAIYNSKCLACHKFEEKVVGPALQDVTKRRSPEWIMNLMVNTNEMVEKDPIVKSMIAEYMTKMTYQDISEADARAILEYFRQKDGVQ